MIKSINVTNHLGESINLELARPGTSGLAVLGVDGLGPSHASLSFSDARYDGGKFNSARMQKRNLVFRLGYFGSGSGSQQISIEDARIRTYKYFPNKELIKIEVETDSKTVETYGYVENNDVDIFTKDSNSAISIVCPNPYFMSLEDNIISFGSITPAFEFPFSNESLVTDLLEVSTLSFETSKNVYYTGEADTGFKIFIYAGGAAHDITIANSDTLESMFIDSDKIISIVGSDITTNDVIEISTHRGNKYARLLRSGTYYNILSALGIDPGWFMLKQGDNLFSYSAVSGVTNLSFEFRYRLLYRGV